MHFILVFLDFVCNVERLFSSFVFENNQFLSSQFNLHMLWSWITSCKAQKKTSKCLNWLQFQMCNQEYTLGNTVLNSVYIFVAFS